MSYVIPDLVALAESRPHHEQITGTLFRWQWLSPSVILGAGWVGVLIVRIAFGRQDRRWERSIAEHQVQWESTTTRLRTQLTEKIAIEDHLSRIRLDLETKLSELSRSYTETAAELDRRKHAERNLTQQRSELARSKDVLQVHVQARSEELQKLQRQYELILNSAGEGICGLNSIGRITFANPTAARLMNTEIKDMVGKKESEIFGSVDGVEAGSDDGKQREVNMARQDGTPFAAEYIRSTIRENGHPLGHVVLFKDITARKQSEMALARKAEELARSNAELEQFAFVASHDLQEPLRKIRAFGDRLKTKCETALPEEGADYLNRMQSAAARMQTLINDLLTFSRVISRTEPFAAVDLNTVTSEVMSDLEVRIEKTGAKVEIGTLPTIDADPVHMRQLIQNLMGNALKFHAPGAKPEVKISGRIIEPVSAADDELCELTVQDNGIGFDEKYLDRIFAVFQRLHGRQEYEGTGIGLAVCRRITDRHNGNITARSKPGEGATFIVTLPVRHKQDNSKP